MIKKLRWHHWTSLGLHLLLIVSMVEIQLSPKDTTAMEVYEVDIVTDVPSRPMPDAGRAIPKYVGKAVSPKTLDSIQKEKALPDAAPELMPSKIEPPRREEPEVETPPQAKAEAPPVTGPGRQGRATDEAAHQMALWTSQVRFLVERVWKSPPEIAYMDKSLKTTYLLRIARSGELMDRRLLISSGNTPFDRSIQMALNSLKKLPQPPLTLVGGRDSAEVTISFNPPKGAQ
jgi:hypothetical protein